MFEGLLKLTHCLTEGLTGWLYCRGLTEFRTVFGIKGLFFDSMNDSWADPTLWVWTNLGWLPKSCSKFFKIRNSEAKLFPILFELWLLMVYRITKWRESADIEEIEYSSLTQERKAKLSAFSPWQTNVFYSEGYRSFSFNLKKWTPFAYFWYEFYISLVLTLWADVNDVW